MRLLTAFLLVLTLASVTWADTLHGTVHGASQPMLVQVITPSNGAIVKRGQYRCPSSRIITFSGAVEQDGTFTILNVSSGRYLIQILSPTCTVLAATMATLPSTTGNLILYVPANFARQLQIVPPSAVVTAVVLAAGGLAAYSDTRPSVSPSR